jgi:hypothetical protein
MPLEGEIYVPLMLQLVLQIRWTLKDSYLMTTNGRRNWRYHVGIVSPRAMEVAATIVIVLDRWA